MALLEMRGKLLLLLGIVLRLMGSSSRPRAAQGIGRRPLGLAVLHRRVSPHLLLVVICRGPSCSCIASVDLRPLFLLLSCCRGQESKDVLVVALVEFFLFFIEGWVVRRKLGAAGHRPHIRGRCPWAG
jgi:hypothetical protein